MRVVVLYGAVGSSPRPDDQDTLTQVEAVCQALTELEAVPMPLAVTLDLAEARAAILSLEPDLVFNLVESLGGSARLLHVAAELLETLGLCYTGAPAESLYLSGSKLLAKAILRQQGIATPDWISAAELAAGKPPPSGTLILKSVWEHASIGIDDGSIVCPENRDALRAALGVREDAFGGPGFAECYISGREFNVTLLERGGGWEVLPVAEIAFVDFPPDKPRIVGYAAKWQPSSADYLRTQRQFPAIDRGLRERLAELATQSCQALSVRGYARADFRVDAEGEPWVLEVNSNPCLSPDAGVAAAAAEVGLNYRDVIREIVAAARAGQCRRVPGDAAICTGDPGPSMAGDLVVDRALTGADRPAIAAILESTAHFTPAEIAVALELVDQYLRQGEASGYHFLLGRQGQRLVGYVCYGPVPATQTSYDVYWIAVEAQAQGKRLGERLLRLAEDAIAKAGGRSVYLETSTRAQYERTRRFYQKNGYQPVGFFPDFYAPGDGKVVYQKGV